MITSILIPPFQTSTVQKLKFLNGKVISWHTYHGCNYFSIPGLKLNHVTKMTPRGSPTPAIQSDIFLNVTKVITMFEFFFNWCTFLIWATVTSVLMTALRYSTPKARGRIYTHIFWVMSECFTYVAEINNNREMWGPSQYKDVVLPVKGSHVEDKTVSTVLTFTWESLYLGKTVFILRRGPAIGHTIFPRCRICKTKLVP